MSTDDLPLEAFEFEDALVSVNTRSLAALAAAGRTPTRVRIVPSSPELRRRLGEEPLVPGQVLPGTRVVVTPSRKDVTTILDIIDIP
jgi:hypothetical protein